MNTATRFLSLLKAEAIEFFAGVPDSLMQGFLKQLGSEKQHVITANEGNAIAMASGYHFATGKTGLVYLQNSGLGNTVNPLTSLSNREMFSVPILLLIGWRGRPGATDEPQHKRMGDITTSMLDILGIPAVELPAGSEVWEGSVKTLINQCKKERRPVALLVHEGFFDKVEDSGNQHFQLSAQDALDVILPKLDPEDILVITTGKLGRLVYRNNHPDGERIKNIVMNAGAMGHASSLACGIALNTDRRVFLFDGDGSLLMHMGALAITAQQKCENLCYVLFNNGAHQSVGGQQTIGFDVDFQAIAKAAGFADAIRISTPAELDLWAKDLYSGPRFIEIRMNTVMPGNLPRPGDDFEKMKQAVITASGNIK